MATHCEICGRENKSRKDRFCRQHQRQVLQKLEAEGYLEPLTVTTVDGVQTLSKHRFLTLPDEPGMTAS
jgi:hypothetical protein